MQRILLVTFTAILAVSASAVADDVYRLVLVPAAPFTRILVAGNGDCTVLDGGDVDSHLAAAQVLAQLGRLARLYQDFRVWIVAKTWWDAEDRSECLDQVLSGLDSEWLHRAHYLVGLAPFAFSDSELRGARALGFEWGDLDWRRPFVLEGSGLWSDSKIGISRYCVPAADGIVCLGEMLSIGHLRVLCGNRNLSADGALLPDLDVLVISAETLPSAVAAFRDLRPEFTILLSPSGSSPRATATDVGAALLAPVTDADAAWIQARLLWLGGHDPRPFNSPLLGAIADESDGFVEIGTDGNLAFWVDVSGERVRYGTFAQRAGHMVVRMDAGPEVVESRGSIGRETSYGTYVDGVLTRSLGLAFGDATVVCLRAYVAEWDKSTPDYGEASVVLPLRWDDSRSEAILDVRISEPSGPDPGYQVWRFVLEITPDELPE